MFQDISQSLVLIAFVWGPLVNGGIQMGTHCLPVCAKGDPLQISALLHQCNHLGNLLHRQVLRHPF